MALLGSNRYYEHYSSEYFNYDCEIVLPEPPYPVAACGYTLVANIPSRETAFFWGFYIISQLL